ncbi:MAG: hypothetical protein IKB65_08275 [Ruminiclostridium sp.]|nr:hypothetical protein [Ruminiclostridium sp.]
MRKALVLPAVAGIGGLIGLVVRQRFLVQAFEPGTGLPVGGVPVTYAMWAVALITAAAIIALSLGKHRTFEKAYTSAFGRGNMIQTSCTLAAAGLFLAAGFFNIEAFVSSPVNAFTMAREVSIVRPILGVVCLGAAAGIWFVTQEMKSFRQVKSIWTLLPGFACCLWVMANYQTWAQDPVIQRYLFSLVAILLSMIGCYCLPGFAFGKGQVGLTLITCLLAAAFGIMVLGDGLPMMDLALVLAMVFYLGSMASVLLDNDARPEPPKPVDPASCGGSCQGCTGCGPVPNPEEKP